MTPLPPRPSFPFPRARLQPRAVSATASAAEVSVTRHDLGDCKVRLDVRVPASDLQAAYQACLEGFAEKANIPGFSYKKGGGRKKGESKLPPANVIVNYVGAKEFVSACVEETLQCSIPQAMQTVASVALQDSERIETPFEELTKAFGGKDCAPELGDLTYHIACEVTPTISWTGDYRKLKVEVVAPGDDVSDKAEAEAMFNQQLRGLGTMRVVIDRGLAVGDQVVMDLDATNKATGEEIEGIKQKKFSLDTGAGRMNLPGLIDGLVGMKVGETKSFDLTMPEDWPQPFLRGVEATFTVSVTEVFENDVPEATDDIAAKIFPEATSVEDAKEKMFEAQRQNTAALLEQATNEALVDALAAICDAPLPASIVEETGRQMYSEKMLAMQMGQNMSMDVINQLAAPEMVEKYLETEREEIERVVRRTVACEELFRLENIEVTEEEFKAEVVSAKEEFERYGTEYDVQRLVEQAGEAIEARKSIEWLRNNAEITILPPVA